MSTIELIWTSWLSWPIWTGFGMLIFTSIWEHYDEKRRK